MGNVRMTAQRRVVLEELERSGSHPSADELYERVRERLPRISLATVYRNLELLAEKGLIRRLELGGTQMRFDAKTAAHYHLRCVGCGRVEDAPVEVFEDVERQVSRRSDYSVVGH